MRRGVLIAAALMICAAVPVIAPARGNDWVRCSGDPRQVLPLTISVNGRFDRGLYVAPAGPPRGLVVFSHGFESSPYMYATAMRDLSARTGVISLALYNPGETLVNNGQNTRGWRVREGARAGIAAAQLLDRTCAVLGARTFVDYGVSMGGNTSGLMAAAGAKRHNGQPLFDYWFDVEGVANVIETYLEAEAVAPTGNSTGVDAIQAIQQENGGRSLLQAPAAYADLAVISHAGAIKAAGIKGVVIVHGLADGLVPHDQSREMEAMLIRAGVPTDFYTAITRTPGTDPGTTLDSDVPVPVRHTSPVAGHGGEGDESQTVTGTALHFLTELFLGQMAPPPCHREFLIDGTLHTIQPVHEGCLAP